MPRTARIRLPTSDPVLVAMSHTPSRDHSLSGAATCRRPGFVLGARQLTRRPAGGPALRHHIALQVTLRESFQWLTVPSGACSGVFTEPRQATPSQAEPHQATPHQAEPHQATPHQAAPHQATPRQATPSQATPSQATPSQATPSQAEPHQATPSQAEPHQAEPHQAEPHQAEPHQAEPHQAEPHQATPSQATPSQATPSQATPSQAEPHQATPSQAEPHQAEPHQAEPHQAEPHQAEPHQAEPHQATPHQAAPHQATPTIAGVAPGGCASPGGPALGETDACGSAAKSAPRIEASPHQAARLATRSSEPSHASQRATVRRGDSVYGAGPHRAGPLAA